MKGFGDLIAGDIIYVNDVPDDHFENKKDRRCVVVKVVSRDHVLAIGITTVLALDIAGPQPFQIPIAHDGSKRFGHTRTSLTDPSAAKTDWPVLVCRDENTPPPPGWEEIAGTFSSWEGETNELEFSGITATLLEGMSVARQRLIEHRAAKERKS